MIENCHEAIVTPVEWEQVHQPQDQSKDLYNVVLKNIQNLVVMTLKDANMFYQRLSSR